MRFTLYYRGKLESNGGVARKHALRRQFHQQLSVLWGRPPLSDYCRPFAKPDREMPSVNRIQGFSFLPLVSEASKATVALDILFLRPGALGDVIIHAGDIDNRLKTLFDALSMPQANQLPKEPPARSEIPFLCLVSDDKLISSVSVRSLELLEQAADPKEVILVIGVTTELAYGTRDNSHLT
jgi:hypothetical protein